MAHSTAPDEASAAPTVPATAGESPSADVQLDDLLQALPDPAIVLARGGVVLRANAKAREHYPSLKAGADIAAAIRNAEFLDAVAAAERGAPSATVTYSERVPVARRVAATVAPLPAAQALAAEGPSVLVSLRDLTEQELLTQMRADFIANASHELRTPLATLAGFIETMQGAARDDPQARDRFLTIMGQQAHRMSRLIDDLLSLSRVEMKAHLPPSGSVDLAETLRYAVDMLQPLAHESDVTLALSAPIAGTVRGEREELAQVFQNLIQNAIKYGRIGGHVGVRLYREPAAGGEGARIAVAVEDDGPGIAPEHVPRLTERFYRVDVASSRDKGGTGLGLAIVKHVVNRHRARLGIESTPGKGSIFTVVFADPWTD